MDAREIESKFFVTSLAKMERRLLEMGALLTRPRLLEVNRRFDLPDGSLRAQGRVLRLRQDDLARLTYKDASQASQGVLTRTELEVTVEDFATTQAILESLGYVQIAVYEKYRRVYRLDACEVMLDELPFGSFVEIEGPTIDSVRELGKKLGLDFERVARGSYLDIFEFYCAGRSLAPHIVTFEALQGLHPRAEELGLQPADR